MAYDFRNVPVLLYEDPSVRKDEFASIPELAVPAGCNGANPEKAFGPGIALGFPHEVIESRVCPGRTGVPVLPNTRVVHSTPLGSIGRL